MIDEMKWGCRGWEKGNFEKYIGEVEGTKNLRKAGILHINGCIIFLIVTENGKGRTAPVAQTGTLQVLGPVERLNSKRSSAGSTQTWNKNQLSSIYAR